MKDLIIACLADSLLFASFSFIGLSRRYVKDMFEFFESSSRYYLHNLGAEREMKGPAVVSPFMKVSF